MATATAGSENKQITTKPKTVKVLMFTLTESVANTWFGVSNIVLIVGAAAVLIGTIGAIAIGSAKEQFSNERISANEAETERARAEAASANARAEEARLELAKLKAPRLLSDAQIAAVAERARAFANVRFDMSVITGDPEAMMLLRSIADSLKQGGWRWVEWNHPNGPFMNVYKFPDTPNIGQGGGVGVGVRVLVHRDHIGVYGETAKALALALQAADIGAEPGIVGTDDIPNHDTIHVVIGKKPL
jgi:hypothetical protein